MFPKTKHFFQLKTRHFFSTHQSLIILSLTVFLLVLLAFALGYLAGEKNNPIFIQVLE